MRIRTIKPEFWISESVGRLTRDSRLAFIGLWSVADDHGRFRADPRYLAGQLFPYDADGLELVFAALGELVREGSLTVYVVAGSAYGALTGWKTHQKIDKPSAAKLPGPAEGQPIEVTDLGKRRETSAKAREVSWEDQGSGIRDQGEDQGEEAPPSSPRKGSRKKPKPQGELPDIVPPPPPRPPTRIGKLHAFFQEEREARLTDPAPEGLELPFAVPDEAPDWGRSGAALSQWVTLWPGIEGADDVDRCIRTMISFWLKESYWASPKPDPQTGQVTPYPWGAFITDKQWRKAFLAAFPEYAEGAH